VRTVIFLLFYLMYLFSLNTISYLIAIPYVHYLHTISLLLIAHVGLTNYLFTFNITTELDNISHIGLG